jgi:hypothetical protein
MYRFRLIHNVKLISILNVKNVDQEGKAQEANMRNKKTHQATQMRDLKLSQQRWNSLNLR